MKTKSFLLAGFLLMASTFTMQAQNALPDPHNDAAWQNLQSLRAWQLDQYNRELSYEQSCTSYPEYQCNPLTTTTAKANPEVANAKSATKTSSSSAKKPRSASNLTPNAGSN